MYTGREPLHVENSKLNMEGSGSNIKFRVKNGCFVERWLAILLVLFFLGCLVAVGLLVFFLAPRPWEQACKKEVSDDDFLGRASKLSKEDVLLPTNLKPIYYQVQLQPFLPPDGNSTFAGKVFINILVLQDTSEVKLHLNNITVDEKSIRAVGDKVLAVTSVGYEELKQMMSIRLKSTLKAGSTVNVSMNFIGQLNDDMAGFYRSSYKDANNNVTWLAVTQFQPTDARRAFPCFDEPDLKAKFQITIIRPSHLISLSNMPISNTTIRDDGWSVDSYETTVKMSTYLLAFAVCDFHNKTNNASNTEFRIWAREQAMDQVDYATKIGPKTLDFYQQYFDIKYPLPKQDMIAVPDFRAGAMENWGLITYRETALLWDPAVSSSLSKQRILTVVTHELAHQWFGNLVTPKWWDDLWLNEGFATYMENVAADYVEPAWKMLEQVVTNELTSALSLDSLETSHPVSVPVNNPDEINEIFDTISYSKGSSIIRMMHHFLGDKVFKSGLINYLHNFSYSNAEQDDLWNFLSEASRVNGSGIDVKTVMDTWTKQTGYPVLTVTRDYSSSTLTITQRRFFLMDSNKTSSERWNIPITYTSASQVDFSSTTPKLWFYQNNDSLSLSSNDGVPTSGDSWMIFNIRFTSFYRVNYDERNWKLITDQLKKDQTVIDISNRAQLIDDGMELARSGLLSYAQILNLTTYIVKESEYLPWDILESKFTYIDAMLKYTASYGKWKRFVNKMIMPQYTSIGFDEAATDSHLKKLLRGIIVNFACATEDPDCTKKAVTLYKQWMDNPAKDPIPPNLKSTVVCTAIRQGGEKEWTFGFERYLKSNVATEKSVLLNALACSREPWILSRYLKMSLNSSSGIRKADANFVFSRVSSNSVGLFLAFNFFQSEWAEIKKQHGHGFFAISNMVGSVTAALNTPFELAQLKQFALDHESELGSVKRTILQSIEGTEANIKWMANSYEAVSAWLDDFHKL